MSELLEWRRHDSHSEICPTEFGPYMVEEAGDEVWAWLPDQQKQARRRVNSGSVAGAKSLCQADVDARRELRDCARLASSQAKIELLLQALENLVGAFESYEAIDPHLADAREAISKARAS